MVLAIQDCHDISPEGGWFNRKKVEMKVSDYLDPRCVLFLNSDKRNEALKELVEVLAHCGKVEDKEAFYQAVLEREGLVSTGIGMQVAIPHAKGDVFKDFFLAVGIQKTSPIEWHSLDKAPVKLVFMIGGPEDQQTKYLKILSHLTQVIKDEKIRKKLLNVSTQEEFMKIFTEF